MDKSILFTLLMLIMCILVFAGPNQASARNDANLSDHFGADTPGGKAESTPFYFRAGYSRVEMDSSSSEVVLSHVGGLASLAIDDGPIDGSGITVEGADFPSVIVGYRLPWLAGHLSVETALALPFTIKFNTAGTLRDDSIAPYALGGIPTGVPPMGKKFGETKVLPPVVTLVYHFRLDKPLRPYVGAGMAYMIAYDEKVTNPVLTSAGRPGLEVDNAFGVTFQGGAEYNFYANWWINFDVKFIAGLETDARVSDIRVETPDLPLYDAVRVGDASIHVAVDPWIYHIGVGFDF